MRTSFFTGLRSHRINSITACGVIVVITGWLAIFCTSCATHKVVKEPHESESRKALDPIAFSLVTTNFYMSVNPVPIRINVSGGAPSQLAVLVDSEDFRAARWTPYASSNLALDLGTIEGWHEVRIGLRATEESNPKWVWQRFKLDFTPPQLIITNPASPIVTQPMIQLQGYCPEDLDSLYYDLTNAAVSVTNQRVLIRDQYFDPKTWEHTTNIFQISDVDLEKGANTFTLRATDQAGNVSVTNLTFTLDYSGATNPPVITLFWPQDGMGLGGDSFTVRGLLNDPTATIVATLTDTNGAAKRQNGLVERDGKFWVENLPVFRGTSTLTLTATDAAGNSSVTNISLSKSVATMSFDALDPQQLHQRTMSISGKVSDSTYSVWVNGVKATVRGDGTWTATNVPVNAGNTANFEATAYAPGQEPPARPGN